jgi:amino acid adenylation domain-containing protein
MRYLLHRLLSDAARAEPNHEAVRFAGRSMTYGELDVSSNGLARALIAAGVRRGDRVAILVPKSLETVVAVYGAMKAGAAYVPLDPLAPAVRAGMVASDCTVSALITVPSRAPATLEAMGDHRPRVVVLVGDEGDGVDLGCPVVSYRDATSDPSATDPLVPVIEDDLAYILYTSGSTGVPKGVMLTHRNGLSFVEWSAERIGITPDDRISNHAPLHFDLSVFDLYLAALGRATLVVIPSDEAYFGASLARIIEEERISVWYSVPSALMLLTRAGPEPERLRSLRSVVFAGEVYPTKHLRELKRLLPGVALWNLYGPTETNVITYYRVEDLPEDDLTIPIGRACENTEVFALRQGGGRAGVGEEGELYARGPTVMKGYWGRPDKSLELLVDNPLPGSLPGPVYRTGDIVRLRPDGDYDFLGRRDHQIKSRGYRIELGEIEAALSTHPSVAEAVAVSVPHDQWGTAIVACVVPEEGSSVTESEIKRHVARRLPRYMVPAHVSILDALPRTSTGKVDRQRVAAHAKDGGSVLLGG